MQKGGWGKIFQKWSGMGQTLTILPCRGLTSSCSRYVLMLTGGHQGSHKRHVQHHTATRQTAVRCIYVYLLKMMLLLC